MPLNVHNNAHRDAILNLMTMAECDCQSLEQAIAALYWLGQTRDLPGAVVEFGAAFGNMSRLFSAFTDKTVHIYDSFKGLPPKTTFDGDSPNYVEGTFREANIPTLLDRFSRHGVKLPTLHPGFFEDLSPDDMPAAISFVHFDGDFYTSTKAALKLAYPRMSPGAVWIAHDYNFEPLPGVKKAMLEFLADKPEEPLLATPWQGMFIKL